MDFRLSEEDALLQRTLRQYALEHLLPESAAWREKPYPREKVRELGELGVLGIRAPEEYGGAGGTYVSMGVAAEELSRGDFSISYFVQLSAIAAGLLCRHERLAAEWVPAVVTGERIVAFGLTEPGVGSDAANLSTTARRDGGDLVVNGEKASITFAGLADACVVFARTGGPGAAGISAVFVPLDVPGVSRRVYSSAGGHLTQRGSLFFDDVRVPAADQVGAEGAGFVAAMEAFDYNRAIIALACIGAALQSLDETVEYVKQRVAFGKPLARHEGVAFQVAEHLAQLRAARLTAYETLAAADEGRPHTMEAAVAKLLGPRAAAEAVHACLLLHGWSGYGTDMPFDQRLRDIIGLEIGDGTPEMMKAVIARDTFGREFSAYK